MMMSPLQFTERPPDEMIERAAAFYDHIRARRTVRDFSDKPVPRAVIENALLAAGTAPNGANKQPWHFTVIESAAIKSRIRVAAAFGVSRHKLTRRNNAIVLAKSHCGSFMQELN